MLQAHIKFLSLSHSQHHFSFASICHCVCVSHVLTIVCLNRFTLLLLSSIFLFDFIENIKKKSHHQSQNINNNNTLMDENSSIKHPTSSTIICTMCVCFSLRLYLCSISILPQFVCLLCYAIAKSRRNGDVFCYVCSLSPPPHATLFANLNLWPIFIIQRQREAKKNEEK